MSSEEQKPIIPVNGIVKNATPRRFTMRRVPRPSPYVEMELRNRFAEETMRSLRAPVDVQVMELELMYQDDDGEANV